MQCIKQQVAEQGKRPCYQCGKIKLQPDCLRTCTAYAAFLYMSTKKVRGRPAPITGYGPYPIPTRTETIEIIPRLSAEIIGPLDIRSRTDSQCVEIYNRSNSSILLAQIGIIPSHGYISVTNVMWRQIRETVRIAYLNDPHAFAVEGDVIADNVATWSEESIRWEVS